MIPVRRRALLGFLSVTLICSSALAVVCREPTVSEELTPRMMDIKGWLPADTVNHREIAVYLTKDSDGDLYIQSNFHSEDTKNNQTHRYPTKIKEPASAFADFDQLLLNLIFDHQPGASGDRIIAEAKQGLDLYIDPNMLTADGRLPFDISGVKSIKLANDKAMLDGGQIELLNVSKPPPPLLQRIVGCCFSGRPAGRAQAIATSLRQTRFDATQTHLMSLVADSATSATIASSKLLNQAALRTSVTDKQNWTDAISTAMKNANGQSLVLLTHVSKGEVVIEDTAGAMQLSIKIDQLHEMAKENDVNLILLGCDTAREAQGDGIPLGVIGKYNTAFAARQLDKAMQSSSNAYEFLSNLAADGLHIVAQEGAWSQNAVGASVYSKPSPVARMRRVLRVWFLGERDG
jgi:hypothetical protein